jgi:hypothetical protein
MVRRGVPLRACCTVLEVLAEVCGWSLRIPWYTTLRMWLMRLGHARLTEPKEQADDWAWLIDHSVQLGPEKCLVILGIRLSQLPVGRALQACDMRLIELIPRSSWTKTDVDQALEAATVHTGVPCSITDDRGSDLHGGVALFQRRHAGTREHYDIKHKAACLLKHRLKHSPRWQSFSRRVGQTTCAIQQTELGCLIAPAPKPKARFMNLGAQLSWATKALAVVRSPEPLANWFTPARVAEKLGWLLQYEADIAAWSEWQAIIDTAVTWVAREGLFPGAAAALRQALPASPQHESSRELAAELVSFVESQSSTLREGERVPGSTEVLESCFGKYKALEKQHSRGGFTSLLLSFGALLGDVTAETLKSVFAHSPVKTVEAWLKTNLGTTLTAKRRAAFQLSATVPG